VNLKSSQPPKRKPAICTASETMGMPSSGAAEASAAVPLTQCNRNRADS